jgi:hypothetical protein
VPGLKGANTHAGANVYALAAQAIGRHLREAAATPAR